MSLFKRLFGGGGDASASPEAEPEQYEGFDIYVAPVKEAGGYRIAARIEKEVDGERKSHQMIRADTCQSADEAERVTLFKAKQLIDQQGNSIF